MTAAATAAGKPHTPILDAWAASSLHRAPWMAGIAQLVERQVVVLDVTGSSPVARPILPFMNPTASLRRCCPAACPG